MFFLIPILTLAEGYLTIISQLKKKRHMRFNDSTKGFSSEDMV
jgi:hypothetical protein